MADDIGGIALSEIIKMIYTFVRIEDPTRREMLLELAEFEADPANQAREEES